MQRTLPSTSTPNFHMTIPQQTTFSPSEKSKHMITTTTLHALAAPLGVKCEKKEDPTSSESNQNSTAPPQKVLAQRKITDIIPTSSAKSDEYSYESDEEPVKQDSKTFDAYRLIDIIPTGTKRKNYQGQGHGRPRKSILDTYLQTCYQLSNPGKHLYRCIGKGCNMTFSNRNLQRTLKHARVCTKVSKELRLKAKELTAKNALSKKVLNNESDSEVEMEEKATTSDMGGENGDVVGKGRAVVKKQKMEDGTSVPTMEWFEEAKRLGKAERHRRLDFAIVLLICAAGLPPFIVSRQEWRNMLIVADPSYTPMT